MTPDSNEPLHDPDARELSDQEYQEIRDMIYGLCRLSFDKDKRALVQYRLNKRLRDLGMSSYRKYLRFVKDQKSGEELTVLINSLTTNLTYFFREPDHYEFLAEEIFKPYAAQAPEKRLRLWSAGCASGEEAYTIAMVLREAVPDIDRRNALILATDVSTRVLELAKKGLYPPERFKETPVALRDKYFAPVAAGTRTAFQAQPELERLIRFRHLNLMGEWPMKQLFDVIICRNVMIYFDRATQQELINRYYEHIKPGGYLIVGHSESFTGIRHKFEHTKKTIHRKSDTA